MIRHFSKWAARCAPLVLSLSACMADVGPGEGQELDTQDQTLIAPSRQVIPFEDPRGVGDVARGKRKLFLRNSTEYMKTFGHSEPLDQVRFDKGDVVVFFSAGERPTGGYEAQFTGLDFVLGRPYVHSTLEEPGAGCSVIQQLSYPYALGVIRGAYYPRVYFRDTVVDKVDCAPLCGGFGGFQCPGEGTCTEDTSDDCNPGEGDADCSGVCVCKGELSCAEGEVWNSAADVCACEPEPVSPCALVLCPPHSLCSEVNGEAVCRPVPTPLR
jgi:hypothetical protein